MLCKSEEGEKKEKKMAQPKPAVQKYIHHGQEANGNVRKSGTEYIQNQLCCCANAHQNMRKICACVSKT